MKVLSLMRQQLDKQLLAWNKLKGASAPRDGWIKTIRVALGMTTYQLAKRMGVNQSRIVSLEMAAKNHTIKLNTLTRVADAMECDLVFALVPRKPLKVMVEDQAKKLATEQVSYIAHSMKLEDQEIDKAELEKEIELRARQLLDGSPSKIWNDE